jgi:cell division septum initiation protein DivIVA
VSDDFRDQVEALREAVRSARSMPMSASAVINRAEFIEALDRLEATLSAATTESHALVTRRDAVIAEAEQSASEIVRQARLEEDRLVSDTEVFRVAQRQAEELLAAARAESDNLRRDAEAYIEQRFANFEHALERTLTEVRRGIANLSGRNAFDEPTAYSMGGSDDVLLAKPEAG